jgi:hypothetical protein
MVIRAIIFVAFAMGLSLLVGCNSAATSTRPSTGGGQGPKAKTDDGKARGAAKDVLPLPGK